jgi:hypothetical protein
MSSAESEHLLHQDGVLRTDTNVSILGSADFHAVKFLEQSSTLSVR